MAAVKINAAEVDIIAIELEVTSRDSVVFF